MKLVDCKRMPPPPVYGGDAVEIVWFVCCSCMKEEDNRFLLGLHVNSFMSAPLNWGFMIVPDCV